MAFVDLIPKSFKKLKLIIMTLVKFNNRPVSNNFDNLFNDFFHGFPAAWTKELATGSVPKANIHETKDAYHVELNVPGRNKENFKVTVEDGLLSVSYEAKEETKEEDYKTLRREFSFQSFKRSFHVDDSIQVDAIQAKYENGVLKLLLPKKEVVAPATKQISIQ